MTLVQAESEPPDSPSGDGHEGPRANAGGVAEPAAAARRRLRALLDGTLAGIADEDAPGGGDTHSARSDADYQRDRPPHHGD